MDLPHIPQVNTKDKESLERTVMSLNSLARQIFDESGYHIPLFILVDKDGGLRTVNAQMYFDTAGGKEMLEVIIKDTVKALDAYAVVFICEAWTKALKKDDEELKDYTEGNKSISEAEDKQEAIIVSAECKDGRSMIITNPVTRVDDKHQLEMYEMIYNEPKEGEESETKTGGRFSKYWD